VPSFAAEKIRKLGQDIGIKNILVLGNRVKGVEDEQLIRESLSDFKIIGFIPEHEEIIAADREGVRPFDDKETIPPSVYDIVHKLEKMKNDV